jgi:hypothetical protein
MTPAKSYELSAARIVLERAQDRLRVEYETSGKSELYKHLKGSGSGENDGLPYAEIAQQLETTEAAIKAEAHRYRGRRSHFIRAEIRKTVMSGADIDDEVRYLMAVFAG